MAVSVYGSTLYCVSSIESGACFDILSVSVLVHLITYFAFFRFLHNNHIRATMMAINTTPPIWISVAFTDTRASKAYRTTDEYTDGWPNPTCIGVNGLVVAGINSVVAAGRGIRTSTRCST